MKQEESFRLHKVHCSGCSDYSNHMGARGRLNEYRTSQEGLESQHGEFDPPPPPPYIGLPTMESMLEDLRRRGF